MAPAGREDAARIEEGVGYGHRLADQTAGIVAQVEDVAEEAVAQLAFDRDDRFLQTALRLPVEAGDPDIADSALRVIADRSEVDGLPRERDLKGLADAVAANRHRDLAAARSAHPPDRLAQLDLVQR